MRLLITGGCGFIGSAVVRHCVRNTGHQILNVDKLTYAANLDNLGEVTQSHVLLRREGRCINQKKTRRIYRELGLLLRKKTSKRRVKAKLREDRRDATHPNETWAMGDLNGSMQHHLKYIHGGGGANGSARTDRVDPAAV